MLEMTYKNKSDQKLYVNPEYIGTFIGQSIPIENMTLSFSNKDLSIINKLKKMKNIILPKSELSDAVLLNISFLETENLEANPAIYFDEPKVYAQKEDGTTYYIFPSEYMLLPLSQGRIDRLALEPVYYPDRITSENWGTKSIIGFAELNQTITAYDIELTLNGMQTVDFLPNSLNRKIFEKWQNGVVLYTVGITIKNNTTQVIDLNNTIANLDTGIFNPVRIPNYEQLPEKTLLQPGDEGR